MESIMWVASGVLVVYLVWWFGVKPFIKYLDIKQITRTAAHRKQLTTAQTVIMEHFVMDTIALNRKTFSAAVKSDGLEQAVTMVVDMWVSAWIPEKK